MLGRVPVFSDLMPLGDLRSQFPSAALELDDCVQQSDYQALWFKGSKGNLGEGMLQAARHAAVNLIKAQVSSSAKPKLDQHTEDCVAEKVALASLIIHAHFIVDDKTKDLIRKHGFLGGMIEQLRPIAKIGKGNFDKLRKASQSDLSAEYCVWKWGQTLIDAKTLKELNILAGQYNFQ